MKKLLLLSLIIAFYGCSTEPIVNTEIEFVNTGVDPNGWVIVPAGIFNYGMHNKVVEINYDFEIMQTHVTNQQFAEYLNAALAKGSIFLENGNVMGAHPGDPFDGYLHEWKIPAGNYLHFPYSKPGGQIRLIENKFVIDKGFENHPVVMVTWFGAKAYADFYGYRLPLEKEWAKAARGADTRAYPWGDHINANITNYGSSKNALQKLLGGNIARTSPVGYYNGNKYGDYQTEDNKSPYGAYDMGGNVWQWLGDDYPNVHYRYMRGGSFTNYEYDLFVWGRNSAGPDYYDFNIGFRCARDIAKPAQTETIILE